MAIHMVTRVDGEDFKITLSRDDAGNYVAEAALVLSSGALAATMAPQVRVVDTVKERALRSLFDSLERLAASRTAPPHPDPGTPAAA